MVIEVSGDRGRGLGYYSNLLGLLKKRREEEGGKLADVQIRLIMREMEEAGMGDTSSVVEAQQMSFFLETIEKYTGLTEADVKRLLAPPLAPPPQGGIPQTA